MEECTWTEREWCLVGQEGLKTEERVRETANRKEQEHRSVINVSHATVSGLVTQTCESRCK